MAVIWIVLGVALLLAEMHHMAFFFLFVALGSFAAAIVAGFAPHSYVSQAASIILVAAIGIVIVRPYMSRVFDRSRGGHVARGVHGGLVGQIALALDEIGGELHPGHVRLVGERWLAISSDASLITKGTTVVVDSVNGTTLTVLPQTSEGNQP